MVTPAKNFRVFVFIIMGIYLVRNSNMYIQYRVRKNIYSTDHQRSVNSKWITTQNEKAGLFHKK
jgi:hypothetical protein